jgi:hypothetical protein
VQRVRGNWLVVTASLGSAFGFAASTSLKHVSAGQVPDAQGFRRPCQPARFARATVAHPLWLLAIGCDVLGLALQLIALHVGSLSVVQPLLITGLLFALILRPRPQHRRITRIRLG